MNPQTLKLTTVVTSGVYGVMGAGTGAIEVNHQILGEYIPRRPHRDFPVTTRAGHIGCGRPVLLPNSSLLWEGGGGPWNVTCT